ncbi:MAG: hypothetical protein DCF19_13890 [Pseudanabaena frigida]|uniref:Uncharacterized protein n=1 Tax=Pseudanabaena frigida TaxID=945775 RepID=A0A2W4W3C3_9CYAN|nr:MAG: hypothetical protein DCF19_13890 [Pseudanabaena frigida]
MALKIGRLEIGYRLLVSLAGIMFAYGWLGFYLCTLLRYSNYPIAGCLFVLAIAAIAAIPQSLGGLLSAIAAVANVYWHSDLTNSLIAAFACLVIYLLGFQDVRYDPAPDKKLSIVEILATIITIAFTVAIALTLLQNVTTIWLNSIAIGAIAGAITLIGKQLAYTDLPQKSIWRLFSILTAGSLAIGLAIKAILFITTKEPQLY